MSLRRDQLGKLANLNAVLRSQIERSAGIRNKHVRSSQIVPQCVHAPVATLFGDKQVRHARLAGSSNKTRSQRMRPVGLWIEPDQGNASLYDLTHAFSFDRHSAV